MLLVRCSGMMWVFGLVVDLVNWLFSKCMLVSILLWCVGLVSVEFIIVFRLVCDLLGSVVVECFFSLILLGVNVVLGCRLCVVIIILV